MATEAKTRSFSDAAKEAGIPPYIKMDALAALGLVTYEAAYADSRTVPGENTETEGFVVTVLDEKGQRYECFIGAQVLVKALSRIEFPFKARLGKEGRSWVFQD